MDYIAEKRRRKDGKMKKLSRHEKHITVVSAILVVMILVSSFFPFSAEAREIRKKQRSYEIAVVFDNSGSMYEGMAWCRAKYAMEIFASMLSYENGDKLRIFPMWGVTVDGSMPENGGSYAPVEINSKDDIIIKGKSYKLGDRYCFYYEV